MARFIKVTEDRGTTRMILINVELIISIEARREGCFIYMMGEDGNDDRPTLMVKESFAWFEQMLEARKQ